MSEKFTVRHLDKNDIPTILVLASELHDEVEREWPECPAFNPELLEQQVFMGMHMKMLYAFGLFADDACVGCLVFIVYPCFGIGCTLGKESMWYVRPAFRTNGLALLKAFEVFAAEKGAEQLEIGHFPMLNGERMAALYSGMGYKLHQLRYLKKA